MIGLIQSFSSRFDRRKSNNPFSVGLLDEFGGAAAAYSLRDLGASYGGPIVKVRRGVDNEEKDFSDTSGIANWVNGKQETVLPADVATAAAAYSLRKVRSAYTGDAVRIRRASDDVEVNVGFDSDDKVSASSPITNVPEEFLSNDFNTWTPAGAVNVTSSSSFTASAGGQGVQLSVPTGTKVKVTGAGTVTGSSVQLFDWSNAGVKATLSGSFSFSTTFTIAGDQQKIYFRSAGATSINFTSLTIEVVNDDGGDTTATTLGAFLNEDVSAYYDAEDGTTTGWISSNFGGSSTTISNVTSGAISGSRSIEIDITSGSTSNGYPRVRRSTAGNLNLSAGLQYRIKCKFKLTAGAAKVYARLGSSSGNFAFGSQTLVVGEVLEIDETFTPSSIGGVVDNIEFIFDGTLGTGTILIDDLELTALNHDAFVVTWYDQSGNDNHATQGTEDNQPKITEPGSLLADGIDFDGSDDQLDFTALSASDLSIFSVVTFDSVAGQERIIGPQSGANEGFGIGNATTGFFRASGTANSPALNETVSADTTTLYSLIRASNTGTFFTNSTASTTFSNSSTFAGASLGGATNPVDGSLKEIIIYSSDQSDNRFKIESNINNRYGLYITENNGFVNTWYDQSGNTNNATQPTDGDQPVIVSGGTLITDTSGRPAVSFGDGTDFLQFTQTTLTNETIFCKSNSLLTNAFSAILSGADNRAVITQASSNVQYNLTAGGFQTISGSHSSGNQVFTFMRDGTNVSIFQNSSAKGTNTALANSSITREVIGRRGDTEGAYTGTIGEYLLYPTARTSDRADIEANIKSHYNIS